MEYAALFEPAEEGGFVITIPDFGWGVSQGDTEAEAREMAAALLQTLVQEHIRKGEDLPLPTRPRGRKYRFIGLSALHGMKAGLYMAFRASGLRKAELARRLGIPRPPSTDCSTWTTIPASTRSRRPFPSSGSVSWWRLRTPLN